MVVRACRLLVTVVKLVFITISFYINHIHDATLLTLRLLRCAQHHENGCFRISLDDRETRANEKRHCSSCVGDSRLFWIAKLQIGQNFNR